MVKNFPKLIAGTKSQNQKPREQQAGEYQKTYLHILYSNGDKEKILKEVKGRTLLFGEQR